MLNLSAFKKCSDGQEDSFKDKMIISSFLLSLFNTYKDLCHEDIATEGKMDALRRIWYEDKEDELAKQVYDDSVWEHRQAEWDHYVMRDTPVSFKIKMEEPHTKELLYKLLSGNDSQKNCKKRVKKILLGSEPAGLLQNVLEKTILLNFTFRQLSIDTRRKRRFSSSCDIVKGRKKAHFVKAATCDIGNLRKKVQKIVAHKGQDSVLEYRKHRKQALAKSRFWLDQFPRIRDNFFSQKRFKNEKLGWYIQMLKRERYFVYS